MAELRIAPRGRRARLVVVLISVMGAMFVPALPANAATPTLTTQATPSAPLGSPISDRATLAGGDAPTGTITFTLFGPNNPTCGGAPVFTSAPIPVTGNGTYDSSPTYTPTAPGSYNWVAAYSGDANNDPVTTPCGAPGETSQVIAPSITVDKRADPATRPFPGGDFTFTVVVTNTSAAPLTITSMIDNVYGDLDGRGTCEIPGPPDPPFTLAPAPGPGNTYSCSFTETFEPPGGGTQTDRVTVVATNENGFTTTAFDDATITVTGVPPRIFVSKTPLPPSMPEPGGNFVEEVTITNAGTDRATIIALDDTIYGDVTDLLGSCEIGVVIEPGEVYDCFFVASFTGVAGATQTDVLSVTALDDDGSTTVLSDAATVRITAPVPSLDVQYSASPASLAAPGGLITFTVAVSNTGKGSVTLSALIDDRAGYLGAKGSCPISTAIAAGATFTCSYIDGFKGEPGDYQIRTVKAIVQNVDGTSAIDNDDVVVSIAGGPPLRAIDAGEPPVVVASPGGGLAPVVAPPPSGVTELKAGAAGSAGTTGNAGNAGTEGKASTGRNLRASGAGGSPAALNSPGSSSPALVSPANTPAASSGASSSRPAATATEVSRPSSNVALAGPSTDRSAGVAIVVVMAGMVLVSVAARRRRHESPS